ncbi:gliding motility-associated C-terminal domain-containing protein [Labilibaculum sp. DW002]|jgi:gliding motility-associated-like protein|uniref:Gliding motility-associated C-terminal domain-containing protein n=1 Tax=Paralabilibaculum antarcticum TaxID=2912572 RepID=A0ABT5VRH2_9BACT|nr:MULTISPECIES: gliding motility-associated C-terminal domain-containing protein [unclassified Labilibaculum]MBI9056524.1 gliding motility-associated C-terminal domain-containing protein [Labilibaculum sp.]MDE5418026.1 gliding motility-associated C-terminal domain-containing protein [Labilibaculum sp. DW002]
MRFNLPVYLLLILITCSFSESFGQLTERPVATNDTVSITNYSATNEVVYIEIDFLSNDKFPDIDQLETSIIGQSDQFGKAHLIENNTLIIFYPYESSYGIDTIAYQICNGDNNCDKGLIVVNVLDPNQVELTIPSSFTPNNDGTNDNFYIKGIENYPENEFIVFSRWGTKVFEKRNYSNDQAWDGGYNKAGVKLGPGDKLPKGTYFFKLIIKDKEYVKSGYIVIKY